MQQQLDILYNQIELKATRFELEGQKKEMQEQNETLRLQKFESTFFQLIGLFNEIKNRIDPQIQSEASKSYFFTFNFKVYSIYNQGKLINSCSDKPIDIIIRAYIENYNTRQDKVSNYFRTLYHIVNFIDKSTISDEDKKRYAAFIRAQLTPSELQILFYNCMTPFGEKFKPLIEKYHLFNNLSVKSLVENESIVKFYHYSAYGKNLQDYPLNDEHLTK